MLQERSTSVAVVGGGMAGIWTAYQLAKAGIETVLITYRASDRGGVQGSSRRSAGAFNLSVRSMESLADYLQTLGGGQTHPSVAPILRRHLPGAIEELASIVDLRPIKIGMALAEGSAEQFLQEMYRRFTALGGTIVDGWVTRVVADNATCRGLQYESSEGIGKIRCRAVVLASGGYSGLFANSIKTNCFGSVLGSFLRAGGLATNLEFLFKHGYGNVDAHAVTPTEELPGAEIYDASEKRIDWIEQLLFHRQGTGSHLQAVQFWLRNPDTEFYVDLSFRRLYLRLWDLASVLEGGSGAVSESDEARSVAGVVELFPEDARPRVLEKLADWIAARRSLGYSMFEELKPLLNPPERTRFRVRPLTYFSMGGISHVDFATSLKNVFVTGEAMHDFGANRVGGLPWSLYLASAYAIRDQVKRIAQTPDAAADDFEIVEQASRFDPELLGAVQNRLYETQEKELTAARAVASIDWLRGIRRRLTEQGDLLHDGISWLLVAEAILQCSLARKESRGFFFRFDYQNEDEQLRNLYSCARYDERCDEVTATLLPWADIVAELGAGVERRSGTTLEGRSRMPA